MELDEIQLLGVKAEVTYGTDPTPTAAANLIPMTSLRWEVQSTRISRKPLRHGHSRISGHNSRKHVVLRFDYELRGNGLIQSGNVANAIEIDPLLQAAGLNPNYTAESGGGGNGSVLYSPVVASDDGKSVTCYWWTQGKLHELNGGKVNIESITFSADNFVVVSFAVHGFYVAPIDATFPSASADFLVDTKPPIWAGAGLILYDSLQLKVEQCSISLGNEIVPRFSANSSHGIAGFAIVDRVVTGSFDPETELVATEDFWANFAASLSKALLVTCGGGSGNNFSISMVNIELTSANYASRNKLRTHALQFEAGRDEIGDSPNLEFAITFS